MIVKVTINGNEYEVSDGDTILNVCRKLVILVPHLCYLKGFSPSGVCGLCTVEVDSGNIVLSCLTPIKDGMNIITDSKRLDEIRKINIDRLLKNHNIDCFNCIQNGSCDLQNFSAKIYGRSGISSKLEQKKVDFDISEISGKFIHDHGKCINCLKCIKFLNKNCNDCIKKIEEFESIDESNDMILNAVDICPTNALEYEQNLIPDFLSEECETYDINDIFTPKFLIHKSDNKIIKIKSINENYISDRTRISIKNIPQRTHIEDDYRHIIDQLTQKIESGNHEKSIFVIGDNLDIVSLYYIKKLSEKLENVRICVNDSQIPSELNVPLGINKSDLISMDFAIFIGTNSTTDMYHVNAFSSRNKKSISLNIDALDQFFTNEDQQFFGYNNPYLFLHSSIFKLSDPNIILEKIKKFKDQYREKYIKSLKIKILPENLSQMLMNNISDKIPISDLFTRFNKHDIRFICVVGDLSYNLNSGEIFTIYNSVLKKDENEYIPSKHFTEDSTYHMNVFGEIIKTNEVIKSNLKSNREFLFDLMKNIFTDEFDDINNEIHKSIRKRFFA